MPENDEFESLVAELSAMDGKPQDAAPAEPVVPAAEPVTEPVAEPEDTGDEDPVTPPAASEPKAKPADNAQAKAFAEMRVKNTQYERALKAAATAENLSVDDYLKKLETESLTKRAQQMQTNPDVLRRLEEAESELSRVKNERVQMHLANEFQRVQTEFKLSDDDLTAFATQLAAAGVPFDNPTTNFTALYRGLNYDKLIERERQEWIGRSQKADQHGTKVLSKNGKNGTSGPTEVTTMEDLDALLSNLT